jgi:hypothetical protein
MTADPRLDLHTRIRVSIDAGFGDPRAFACL